MIDPNWAILYLRDQATHYKGLNSATINRLKMDKNKFAIAAATFAESLRIEAK